jgi:diguanylate cyclase (GGDEF)-like protein
MAQRIAWAATHDALTGLVNRREFETRLDAALEAAREGGPCHVLCHLDLDPFKWVNDTCGPAAGDQLLKQLADTLQGQLRGHDTLARLGGHEFGLLLRDCRLEDAEHRAADLLARVRAVRFHWEGQFIACGASVGLVEVNAAAKSRTDLFAAADSACCAAREQGRDRVCAYRAHDAEQAQRHHDLHWAARLNKALEEDRLVLYFQPYLPLNGAKGGGAHIEILLRLRDEDGTLVEPAAFLPAAERFNLMPVIDRWVIAQVFSRYHDLAAQMGAPLVAAINLSGTTLNAQDILPFIQVQAQLHPVPAGGVCFEITESAAIDHLHKATQFMHEVKALGFSFALDEFGIGTRSLAYLKTLPVDYLKIDGRFVRNLVNDPIDRATTETINRVGHIMGLKTVGEYADTPAVIDELRRLGVDYAQGSGVQRPTPLPPPRNTAPQRRTATLTAV